MAADRSVDEDEVRALAEEFARVARRNGLDDLARQFDKLADGASR